MRRMIVVVTMVLLIAAPLFSAGQEERKASTDLPYSGTTLRLAVCAEQYADYLTVLGKRFGEETGAEVKVDIIGYVELYQKITQDYASGTKLYDLATVDIVWSGEFAQKGWTVDLKPWIERDSEEIDYDDIIPVMWAMGSWDGKQVAYPMAGYANSLIYRKDLIESPAEKEAFKAEYGYELQAPETLQQLEDIAEFFTRPDENLYGLVANGARGSAVAQDWMEYLRAFGGMIFDENGNVAIDSPEGLASLEFFVDIFDKYAPPGAIGYWWDDRETAYRTGQAVMQSSWSIARAGYEDQSISLVAGKTAMGTMPTINQEALYGVGGWGIGINSDIDSTRQEIAWEFIKWITSPEIMKDWMMNDGAPIRRSTHLDEELLAEKPWLPTMLKTFENGDGDYRPRSPQATQIQDILGLRVNQAITHELTAAEALRLAAEDIEEIL
jgi:multiple sugar transport system substrate-binding protein